jgi:hypothetical protein
MKTLGSYITKFENQLVEGYKTNTFKKSLTQFKNEVLKNNDLKEATNIYYELSSKKGYDKEFAEMFLNESINRLKEIYQIKEVQNYLSEGENNYTKIDELVFSKNIEKKVKNRISIIENLQQKQEITETIYLPLSIQVDIANSKIKPLLENLSEEELSLLKEMKEISENDLVNLVTETKTEILDVFEKNSIEENKLDELKNKLGSYNNSHRSLFELRRFLNELV